MNENQGPKKTKERLVQPSRAEQQRGGNVSELFVCCSVLFSEVSFWSDVWGQTVPEVTTRFYNTSQLKMMWTLSVVCDRSRFYVTFSPSARHMSTPFDAKTQRGIWDDSSCCDRAVLLVLLRILNPEDTILLDSSVLCESNLWWNNQTDSSDRICDENTESSLRLCNMKTRRNKSCWFYSDRFCDFSLVLDWFWFWFFFFTDKHSWNHDYMTFVGVCSKCFLTFVFISSCSVTFFTFHPKK